MISATPSQLKALEVLTPILKEYGLESFNITQYNDNDDELPKAALFAEKVLSLCGLTSEQIKLTVHGQLRIGENDLFHCKGWVNDTYRWFVIHFAISTYANMMIDNDKKVEVGLKYPEFNKAEFIKKFKLTFKGRFENMVSIEWRKMHPKDKKSEYDVYTDPQGNIYSFQPDGIGKGGYTGFIFNDATTAYNFITWYFKSKGRKVDEVHYLTNFLGGLRKCDLTAINSQMVTA